MSANEGAGELSPWRALAGVFKPGDVTLADALYCNHFLIATLARIEVEVLFEQNGSRFTDFRRGRRLGTRAYQARSPPVDDARGVSRVPQPASGS